MPRKNKLTKIFACSAGITIFAGGGIFGCTSVVVKDILKSNDNCVTLGAEILNNGSVPKSHVNKLSKSLELLKTTNIGKNLYKKPYDDKALICRSNKKDTNPNSLAFLKHVWRSNPYIGYNDILLKSSTASVASTLAHEFQHYYQSKKVPSGLWLNRFDPFQLRVVNILVFEATAKSAGILFAYDLKKKYPNIQLRKGLQNDIKHLEKYMSKYKNALAYDDMREQALRDMMKDMLIYDNGFEFWRQTYLTHAYMGDKKESIDVYRDIIKLLSVDSNIDFSQEELTKLTTLPNGYVIMPKNITPLDILKTANRTAEKAIVNIERWQEYEQYLDELRKANNLSYDNKRNSSIENRKIVTKLQPPKYM